MSIAKAMKRLQGLLDHIPQLRAEAGAGSSLNGWRQEVQLILSQFYGRYSLQTEQFDKIRFGQFNIFTGEPSPAFIKSLLADLA